MQHEDPEQVSEDARQKKRRVALLWEKISNPFVRVGQMLKTAFQRFNPREKYFVIIFTLVIAAALLGVGAHWYLTQTSVTPAFGGEYREAVIGTPRFINPVLASTNDVDRDIANLIYAGLMKYDAQGNLVPDLAKTYEVTDDGTQYRFTLRENLVWEDGTPLTAEDVVYTIQLIQDPQNSSPLFQSWQGVEITAEDEHTVVFDLSSAYIPFLENTTIGIMPKHIWQDVSTKNFALSEFNLQPVGAGRFRVEKFTKDNAGFISSYTLRRNERYHGKKPFLSRITFKFYDSETEAITAYNNKAADGMAFISPANITELDNAETTNIHDFSMPRYFAVFMSRDRNEIFEEEAVRKALSRATNRQQLVDDILLGFGEPMRNPFPPVLEQYHTAEAQQPVYDLEAAKEILAEDGWNDENADGILEKTEDGTTQELRFRLTTVARPELEQAAQLLAKQWRQVGVELDVATLELGELQQNVLKPRNYELLLFGEILGTIPDPFAFWHSSQIQDPGLNLANYENEDVDTLLEEARQATTKEERIEKYQEFQETVAQDIPAIFLYNPSYLYPIQKSVQGVEPALIADSAQRFVDVEHWFIETKREF